MNSRGDRLLLLLLLQHAVVSREQSARLTMINRSWGLPRSNRWCKKLSWAFFVHVSSSLWISRRWRLAVICPVTHKMLLCTGMLLCETLPREIFPWSPVPPRKQPLIPVEAISRGKSSQHTSIVPKNCPNKCGGGKSSRGSFLSCCFTLRFAFGFRDVGHRRALCPVTHKNYCHFSM